MQSETRTYQTRIRVTEEESKTLLSYAKLMSTVVRALFAQAMAGRAIRPLKSSLMQCYALTARQFNACAVQVEAKIKAAKSAQARHLIETKERLQGIEKKLAVLEKKAPPSKIYAIKVRYTHLSNKYKQLKADQEKGKVAICFGSRKRFRAQFTQVSHKEWKEQWESARNREFFALGSKDESGGNQTCTATLENDGSLTLRCRLPNSLGKYLTIRNVFFSYGHKIIVAALKSGQAISYRFLFDKKGWRVFASTSLLKPAALTDRRLGAIGIDINSNHLALVETDRCGNPITSTSLPVSLYGKSHSQIRAILRDICAKAVSMAREKGKPLVVERLDFAKKKLDLREHSPKYARMLSSFAYSALLQNLHSRAYSEGVEIFSINPAFTSLIGRIKYASRYGLSTHQAAALCIARRFFDFSERPPSLASVPDGKGRTITFSLPVRNGKSYDWRFWKLVAEKLKAALAGHLRVTKCQSTGPPRLCV